MPSLKYFPRLNLYKAANVQFDPSTLVARSYDWWTFVCPFNKTLVFNTFPYSATTRRHQSRVRQTMQELGITDVLVVETRKSLCSQGALQDALATAQVRAKILQDKASRARSNKSFYLEQAAEQLRRAKDIQKLIARTEAVRA